MSVDTQIPVLICQTGRKTAVVRSFGAFAGHVLVGIFFAAGDRTIFCDIFAIQRLTIIVISLLQQVESIRSFAYHVDLQIFTRTTGITSLHIVIFTVDGVQLRNFGSIPGKVTADSPFPILILHGNHVDTDFQTFALHITDIGFNHIGKVASGRNEYLIQQIFGSTPVVVNRTGDAVVQETIVDTDIISFGSLPLDVGIVAIGTVSSVPLITEVIAGFVIRRRISRQVLIVRTNGLLTGLAVAQTEFQIGQGFEVREESLFVHTPGCRN